MKKDIIILDGAMGTVLQQRGLPAGGVGELLNLTDPDLLRSVYREYIDAGSQIIFANTFGANGRKMASTGYSVEEIIAAAIRVAKELRKTPKRRWRWMWALWESFWSLWGPCPLKRPIPSSVK